MSNNTQVRNLLSELVPTPTGQKDADGNPILVENKSVQIPTASAVSLYDLIAPHPNTERVVIQLDGQIRVRTDGEKSDGFVRQRYSGSSTVRIFPSRC